MSNLKELQAQKARQQELQKQLASLAEDEKIAQSRLAEARARCQKESLDIKKLEENEFKQFWLKLRGTYEKTQMENNARTTEAMQLYHEAQEKVFELEQLHKKLDSQLEGLKETDAAYQKAYALKLEHVRYSSHNEELIRLQQKLEDDDYQLKLLAGAANLIQISTRKAAQLKEALTAFKNRLDAGQASADGKKEGVDTIISAFSELKVLLSQLESELDEVDSLETQTMRFDDVISLEPVAIFYDRSYPDRINPGALNRALSIAEDLAGGLAECDGEVDRLTQDLKEARSAHQEKLEQFVCNVTFA
jgi:hypothetical protein